MSDNHDLLNDNNMCSFSGHETEDMCFNCGDHTEGDWKVAAMVRLMKIMTGDLKNPKGTSMLEDYTYNLVKGKERILEAHMLEICPSIA